jgi:hypothetical protein
VKNASPSYRTAGAIHLESRQCRAEQTAPWLTRTGNLTAQMVAVRLGLGRALEQYRSTWCEGCAGLRGEAA